MRVARLFQKTMFGIFLLFGLIAVSTSALCVYTVDKQLSGEYLANSQAIAQTIANSSVDIILNRDLSTLQSLIDQFKEIQGIKYVYIVDEAGDMLAHTFVPGIPKEIMASDRVNPATVHRRLPGFGEFVEVSSPILDGIAGSVHVGMDKGLIALKIQIAIGRQIYLISIIFIVGIVGSFLLVNLAAKPLGRLGGYAMQLAAPKAPTTLTPADVQALLERNDEVGQLARLCRHLSGARRARPCPRRQSRPPAHEHRAYAEPLGVAVMGTLLQLCLGTVYAWSFFQSLLVKSYRWSYTETAWAFSLVIFTLGVSAAWAGVNLPRLGPRRLASMGALLFSLRRRKEIKVSNYAS